jgi:hypothetical protein
VLPGWIVRWRNVDLDRAALRIVEQTKSALRLKSTDHARAAILANFAIEELRRLKWEQAESLLMLGVRQTGDTCGLRSPRRRAITAAEPDARISAVLRPT